jgi:hypothetical protein
MGDTTQGHSPQTLNKAFAMHQAFTEHKDMRKAGI